MAAKGNIPEFRTLKECLQFLEWLHSDRQGRLMKGRVAESLNNHIRTYYKNVDSGRTESALSAFLSKVSHFYTRLCHSTKPGNYGSVNAEHVTGALLQCLPKFLAVMYYLWYDVNATFDNLGGGGWKNDYPGALYGSWVYRNYGGDLDKYLYAKEGSSYGGMIPGGFGENEVKYAEYYTGYYQGLHMALDLESLLDKDSKNYNVFRDILATSVFSASGDHKANTANVLALVKAFCQVVENDSDGSKLIEVVQKHETCINWPELKKHCTALRGKIDKLFTRRFFDHTGQSINPKHINAEKFAETTANWLRENLGTVRSKLERINTKDAAVNAPNSRNLGAYFTNNLFPYGFVFGGNHHAWNSRNSKTLLQTWREVMDMLSKDDEASGGLKKLVKLLNGDACPVTTKTEATKPNVVTPSVEGGEKSAPKSAAKTPQPSQPAASKPAAAKPPATTPTSTPGGKPNGAPNQGTAAKGSQNQKSSNNVPSNQKNGRNGGNAQGSSVKDSPPSPSPGGTGASGPKSEKGPQGSTDPKQTSQVKTNQNTVQQQTTSAKRQPVAPPLAPAPPTPAGPAPSSQPSDGSGSKNGGGGAGRKAGGSSPPGLPQTPSAKPSGSPSSVESAPGGGQGPSVPGQPGGNGLGAPGGSLTSQQPVAPQVPASTQAPSGTTQGSSSPGSPSTGRGLGPSDQGSTSSTTQHGVQGTPQSSATAATTTSNGSSGGGGGKANGDEEGKAEEECNRLLNTKCKAVIANITKAYKQKKEKNDNDAKKWQKRWDELQEEKYKKSQQQQLNKRKVLDHLGDRSSSAPSDQDGFDFAVSSQPTPGDRTGSGRDYYALQGRDIGQGSSGVQNAEISISLGGEAVVDTDLKELQDEWNHRIEADEKRKPLDWHNQASADLKQLLAFSLHGAEVSDVTNQLGKYVTNTMGSDVTPALNQNVDTSAMYDLDGDVVAMEDVDDVVLEGTAMPDYTDIKVKDEEAEKEWRTHQHFYNQQERDFQGLKDRIMQAQQNVIISGLEAQAIKRTPRTLQKIGDMTGEPIKPKPKPPPIPNLIGQPILDVTRNRPLRPLPNLDFDIEKPNTPVTADTGEAIWGAPPTVVLPSAIPDDTYLGVPPEGPPLATIKDLAVFADPYQCENPWYIPAPSTSTTPPPLSPPPDSSHLPLPRTVRQMLYWFVGLNQLGYIGVVTDHVEKLFKDFKGDTLEVSLEPYTLDASVVTTKLTEACLYAASVIYKIKYKDSFDAYETFFKDQENYAFYYSTDPSVLLCQLRDYVYTCCHQLLFLKAQCKRDKLSGGWKNYEYGSDITSTTSPLHAFLTDSWDSTFKTHPFDPCNLCLKSRVRMGFSDKDLPDKSENGTTLSSILTPSCGGEDPLLTLCSYLNCLTRRTPRTTGELVSYFHNFGHSIYN